MLEISFNVIAVVLLTSPLLLLELLRKRLQWVERNHTWLNIVLWASVLSLVYAYVLPALHRAPLSAFIGK